MPAIADKTLAVITAVQSIGNDALVSAIRTAEMMLSVSRKANHLNPNAAVLLLAVKNTLNLSMQEFGKNRVQRAFQSEATAVFVNGDSFPATGQKDESWFSILSNVKQGGRKTVLHPVFVQYLANAIAETFDVDSDVALKMVQDADSEDVAIRLAFAAANK